MRKSLSIDLIFWFSYILVIFAEMFNNISLVEKYSNFITSVGLLIMCVYVFMKNKSYSIKFVLLFPILIFASILTFLKLDDFTILKFIMLLFALKNIDFSRFIKNDFKIRIIMFVTVFLCSCVGLCEVTSFIRENITRYTLGFIHPNTTGFYLLLIGLEYIYINKDSNKINIFIVPIFICLIINFITDSRTSLLAMIITILGLFYVKFSNNKLGENRFFKILTKNLFLIITCFTVVLIELFSKQNSFAIFVNDSFSFRLTYFSYFWTNYSIKLLGNDLNTYFVLDSTYLQLLLRFGLIAYLFYYIMYVKRIEKAFKEKDYLLIIIMIAMLFYGFTENAAFKSTYNIFLLSFSDVIFKKNKEIDKNEK